MFLESLVESCAHRQPRRRWATLVSFSLQTVCVAALVFLPLLYTGALPPLTFNQPLLPPPAAPPRPKARPQPTVELVRPPSNLTDDGSIREPQQIPTHVYVPSKPEVAPPPPYLDGSGPGVLGSTGPALTANNRVIADMLEGVGRVLPERPKVPPRIPASEGVQNALLIHRVTPPYPPIARQAGIQGAVVMHAVISKDGTIEQLQVLSGHPLLIKAATDAVRQWRYQPTYLNRQPVEVDTEITINFVLAKG